MFIGMYSKIKYKDIEVSFLWRLNGGGIIFAHEFVHIVAQRIGKVGHVFEYCAGPGFIGFCLLANNLCDKLTVADVNPLAVEVLKDTVKNNGLQDRVAVYQADCLETIPETEQWDLVVGNPPWVLDSKNTREITVCDPDGRVHKNFFRDIKKYLKPRGSILFIESTWYTTADSFKAMIGDNDLELIESLGPVSYPGIFKEWAEYKGLKTPLIIFLRLCLAFRDAYFLWIQRKESLSAGSSAFPRP